MTWIKYEIVIIKLLITKNKLIIHEEKYSCLNPVIEFVHQRTWTEF